MKRLTIDQLVMLERLHGKEYTLNGTVRKMRRTLAEDRRLGIPQEHREYLHQRRWGPIRSTKLRQLLGIA